jgi:hypothetical protein
VTSLTAIFGHARGDARDSEKLLELYWNRAELKKEFANLRNETYRLKDRIKEQQGHAARAQQQLLQLENLLLDPEWVHSVTVFYQLRALNALVERKVARFAEQLKQQREQRQHRRILEAWDEKRKAEADSVAAQLGDVRDRIRKAGAELNAVQARYSGTNRVLRFLRKRSTKRALDAIAAGIEADQGLEREHARALASLERGEPPDVQGLDVHAKRSINCMILSYAQQAFLHFREDGIAAMAREAASKGAGAVRYGSKADCDQLLVAIHRLQDSMVKTGDCAELLQQRAKLIAERARFDGDNEAAFEISSVGCVFDIETGRTREVDANLLRDNYWGLASVLSR